MSSPFVKLVETLYTISHSWPHKIIFSSSYFSKPKPKPKPAHLQSPKRESSPDAPSPPPRNNNHVDSPLTIEELLNAIGMTRYIENFHRNGYYSVVECLELTEDDLQKMGIGLSGHQYKIVKNIRLKEEELGRVSPTSP